MCLFDETFFGKASVFYFLPGLCAQITQCLPSRYVVCAGGALSLAEPNNRFALPTCSLNLKKRESVLRMRRAFPFKQGGLSLFAVLAPMATQ